MSTKKTVTPVAETVVNRPPKEPGEIGWPANWDHPGDPSIDPPKSEGGPHDFGLDNPANQPIPEPKPEPVGPGVKPGETAVEGMEGDAKSDKK